MHDKQDYAVPAVRAVQWKGRGHTVCWEPGARSGDPAKSCE